MIISKPIGSQVLIEKL